jgi:hypothetical protein
MAKIALIDNVLLQRASGTEPGFFEQLNMNISLPMAQTLPPNYAGIVSKDESTAAVSSSFRYATSMVAVMIQSD